MLSPAVFEHTRINHRSFIRSFIQQLADRGRNTKRILSEAQPQSGRAIGYARAARGTRQTNATISCRRELASCRPRWPSDRPRVRFLPNSIGTSACQSMHSHVVASRLALPTQWPCTGQGCAVRSRDEEPVAGASVHAVVPLVPKPAWPRASLHT